MNVYTFSNALLRLPYIRKTSNAEMKIIFTTNLFVYRNYVIVVVNVQHVKLAVIDGTAQ